ncbi:MAG: copper resistance protein CopC [Alphaproteobacteria bacterium]
MRRVLVVAAVAMAGVFAVANEARAHARLVASSPGASAELVASPPLVELWFNELLDQGFHEVSVVPAGDAAAPARPRSGAASVDPDDRTHLSAPIERLPEGVWVVSWRVLSLDGHGARRRFEFRVVGDRGGAR